MQKQPPHPHPKSASKGTATSDGAFVETIEHRRFIEFCDACRNFRHIGLCYGPPGIGKTLSAVRYSRADQIRARDAWTNEVKDNRPVDTVLYTTSVVNTPSRVDIDISLAEQRVRNILLDPIQQEARIVLDEIRLKDEKRRGTSRTNRVALRNTPRRSILPTSRHTSTIKRNRERFQTRQL
jgi:hypothetical protein